MTVSIYSKLYDVNWSKVSQIVPGMRRNSSKSKRALLAMLVVVLTGCSASASEIRVVAARSLKQAFTAIFADYARQYGVSFAPVFGPSGELRQRLRNGEAFDIFASAALSHAQALTEAGISGPSVLFVRNALCIVTDAGRQIDRTNMIETLLRPEIRIGTSTPVSDPAGDYTWEIFHRIDAKSPGAFAVLSKKAQQLFGGPTMTTPVDARQRLLIALDDHEIDLLIYYCSGARDLIKASAKYVTIELPPELSVGPEYGLTVSRQALPGAADFAMYLLSPQGQTSLQSFGFIPVTKPSEAVGKR